ncbi:MAG: ABC transporter substrate-binding protein [Treponema sp.]|nr:ABC transporter substrate-binding protein [Treponema sp.]
MKKCLARFGTALVAAALVCVAAACGKSAVSGRAGENHLVVVLPSFPVSLDNTKANEFNSLMIHHNITETLVKFDGPNFNIVPGLAESWHMPNPQTLVMNLRRGVRFHNGDEMRASDVQVSVMRGVVSPPVRFIHGNIESVDIIDDYTVQINLRIPFVPILAHLTHPGAAVNSERALRELGDEFANQPVGTGPFKFQSMTLGDSIELVRFEDYWGERPGVDRISFTVIPEGTNRLIAVETGAADVAFDISPHHLPRMVSDSRLAYDRSALPRFHFLGFNQQSPTALPLRDVRVRQAINHAIDVEAIVDIVYQGVGRLTNGPMVGIPGVVEFEPLEFDLDRARQLMAEAGYADGFAVTLWCTVDNQQEVDKSVIIQNMLAQIGIRVEVISLEFATFLQGVTSGQHDMYVLSWNNGMADPDYGLALFHSSNIGGSNRFRYHNPNVDRLLDRGRQELDPAARLDLYREAQRLIVADHPAVFLLHGEELVALSPQISGFVNFPFRFPRLNTVYFKN